MGGAGAKGATLTASATGPRTRSAGKLIDVDELPEYKHWGKPTKENNSFSKSCAMTTTGAQSVRAPLDWALQDHRSAAGRFQKSGPDRKETFA